MNSTDEEGAKFIWKDSPDSLQAGGIHYNFSSVFGSGSTQVWCFHFSYDIYKKCIPRFCCRCVLASVLF